ncbi:MAG: YegS/Rv2252/BmrU family lipid kinase [Cetobacterium sp.]|uniref:YegS/Rv2252/BmrU family lipid kinase n=1 Tax=Cetobacterium sp. TaxID=2071632 RepID=UPI002FC5E4FE
MKKVKFIYNPHAGEKVILEYIDKIIYMYQKKGFVLEPFRISFEFDINETISEMDDTYHHILISGGDGTINQVINSMKNKGLDLPIAILPTGTANDFATLLEIDSDIEKAVEKILTGEFKKIDLGKANEKYFVNVFSCGLFTEVSQKTPSVLKNTFGKLAYYLNGIKEIPHFKKINIKVETDSIAFSTSALVFFVFNGKSAGSLKIAYKSKADDGMLDVIIFKNDGLAATFSSVFRFLREEHLDYPEGVVHFKTNRVKFTVLDDINTDIDGEPGPKYPVEIECIQGGLKILGI